MHPPHRVRHTLPASPTVRQTACQLLSLALGGALCPAVMPSLCPPPRMMGALELGHSPSLLPLVAFVSPSPSLSTGPSAAMSHSGPWLAPLPLGTACATGCLSHALHALWLASHALLQWPPCRHPSRVTLFLWAHLLSPWMAPRVGGVPRQAPVTLRGRWWCYASSSLGCCCAACVGLLACSSVSSDATRRALIIGLSVAWRPLPSCQSDQWTSPPLGPLLPPPGHHSIVTQVQQLWLPWPRALLWRARGHVTWTLR